MASMYALTRDVCGFRFMPVLARRATIIPLAIQGDPIIMPYVTPPFNSHHSPARSLTRHIQLHVLPPPRPPHYVSPSSPTLSILQLPNSSPSPPILSNIPSPPLQRQHRSIPHQPHLRPNIRRPPQHQTMDRRISHDRRGFAAGVGKIAEGRG